MDQSLPPPKPKASLRNKIGCGVLILLGLLFVVEIFDPFFYRGSRAMMNAKITAVSLNGSIIVKGLMHYAEDHDGKFPEGRTHSNEAFRQLFPDYVDDEKLFFVPHSAWHDAAPKHRPDGDIGTAPGYARCLQEGENHWAFVSGLGGQSPPGTPLLADDFADGPPWRYTDNPKKKGGVWKGAKAIVIFADGSVEQVKLSARDDFHVMKAKPDSAQKVDLFTREGGLPENAKVLNPQ